MPKGFKWKVGKETYWLKSTIATDGNRSVQVKQGATSFILYSKMNRGWKYYSTHTDLLMALTTAEELYNTIYMWFTNDCGLDLKQYLKKVFNK